MIPALSMAVHFSKQVSMLQNDVLVLQAKPNMDNSEYSQ